MREWLYGRVRQHARCAQPPDRSGSGGARVLRLRRLVTGVRRRPTLRRPDAAGPGLRRPGRAGRRRRHRDRVARCPGPTGPADRHRRSRVRAARCPGRVPRPRVRPSALERSASGGDGRCAPHTRPVGAATASAATSGTSGCSTARSCRPSCSGRRGRGPCLPAAHRARRPARQRRAPGAGRRAPGSGEPADVRPLAHDQRTGRGALTCDDVPSQPLVHDHRGRVAGGVTGVSRRGPGRRRPGTPGRRRGRRRCGPRAGRRHR